MDVYKKVQFDVILENFILLFVFYDVIKFKAIENNIIFKKFLFWYLEIVSGYNLAKVALWKSSLC